MQPPTHSYLLLLPREALLACPPFPLWNLPFFTVESTLSSSCPQALTTVQLSPILTLFSQMIWYSGLMALFLHLFAKVALAYLPTAFSVAMRPLFSFQQAQYAQVFPLKPAPFCMLFAGLGSTNKPATSLFFSFYLTLVLSSPSSFLSPQTLWQTWQLSSLSSCSIKLQWALGHSFLPGNNAADVLARRGVLLTPYAIPCGLCPLISQILFCLFLNWMHTVSSKFNTQVPLISTEELVLPHHACCVLSRLCCNKHSLLLSSYYSRIGRIETPSCSTCGHSSQGISHLILHRPPRDSLHRSLFGNSLSLYNLWSRPWGVARLLGLRVLLPWPHPSEGVG